MKINKIDYTNSYRKKEVQKLVYQDIKKQGFTKLIGLAGPNINSYLQFVKQYGIKQAEVYENEYVNMLYQMRDFQPPIKTTVNYQDIYYAPVYQDVLYDLDFTCTIKNADLHLKKFKHAKAIITLSLRGVGVKETIKKFCKIISNLKPEIKYNVLVTPVYKKHTITFDAKTSYSVYVYKDTSSMLTIQPNF